MVVFRFSWPMRPEWFGCLGFVPASESQRNDERDGSLPLWSSQPSGRPPSQPLHHQPLIARASSALHTTGDRLCSLARPIPLQIKIPPPAALDREPTAPQALGCPMGRSPSAPPRCRRAGFRRLFRPSFRPGACRGDAFQLLSLAGLIPPPAHASGRVALAPRQWPAPGAVRPPRSPWPPPPPPPDPAPGPGRR